MRSKCLFSQPEVDNLGHHVGSEGIKKIAVIRERAMPQKVSEVHSLLGLTSCFHRFVQGFANMVGDSD